MSDFLNIIHTESKNINHAISRLCNYSKALYIVGNNQLSDDLFELAMELKKSINNINSTVNDKVNEDFDQSIKNSANLLQSYLAAGRNKK